MNFNKIVLDKINNFVLLSKKFDNNYQNAIMIQDEKIDDESRQSIFMITKYYIELRSTHGELILLIDKFKNMINSSELTDNTNTNTNTNIYYDLSTFSSILSSINELVTNIDFQYKKIAIKYPNFINKKPLTILLLTDNDDEDNNFVKLLNGVKEQVPENNYKIIKCKKSDKKMKCDKILGVNMTLKIPKLPTLFIINGSNIVEIPIDKFNEPDLITNLIK
jgi:hypothetical protein